jgi:hypothetical protein
MTNRLVDSYAWIPCACIDSLCVVSTNTGTEHLSLLPECHASAGHRRNYTPEGHRRTHEPYRVLWITRVQNRPQTRGFLETLAIHREYPRKPPWSTRLPRQAGYPLLKGRNTGSSVSLLASLPFLLKPCPRGCAVSFFRCIRACETLCPLWRKILPF